MPGVRALLTRSRRGRLRKCADAGLASSRRCHEDRGLHPRRKRERKTRTASGAVGRRARGGRGGGGGGGGGGQRGQNAPRASPHSSACPSLKLLTLIRTHSRYPTPNARHPVLSKSKSVHIETPRSPEEGGRDTRDGDADGRRGGARTRHARWRGTSRRRGARSVLDLVVGARRPCVCDVRVVLDCCVGGGGREGALSRVRRVAVRSTRVRVPRAPATHKRQGRSQGPRSSLNPRSTRARCNRTTGRATSPTWHAATLTHQPDRTQVTAHSL